MTWGVILPFLAVHGVLKARILKWFSIPFSNGPHPVILFIIGDWNAKVGSQETWTNRQIWPWSTKWNRAKANRGLSREHTDHSKHPLSTTQRWLYTWTSPNGQYWNRIDYTLCSQRWRSCIQSAKITSCGSDHQLLMAKFMLKRKKVGRPLGQSGTT